jgi:hypothetical protein
MGKPQDGWGAEDMSSRPEPLLGGQGLQ